MTSDTGVSLSDSSLAITRLITSLNDKMPTSFPPSTISAAFLFSAMRHFAEGLRAVGGNWFERVRFAYVPQVMPNFVSYFLLRTEINVRASTIIGAVGGGGIGEVFRLSIGRDHAAKTFAIIILLLVTIVAIDWLSGYLRRRLVGDAAFQFGA